MMVGMGFDSTIVFWKWGGHTRAWLQPKTSNSHRPLPPPLASCSCMVYGILLKWILTLVLRVKPFSPLVRHNNQTGPRHSESPEAWWWPVVQGRIQSERWPHLSWWSARELQPPSYISAQTDSWGSVKIK